MIRNFRVPKLRSIRAASTFPPPLFRALAYAIVHSFVAGVRSLNANDHKKISRLINANFLRNRAQVGGQWLRATYAPRGMSFVVSVEMRF